MALSRSYGRGSLRASKLPGYLQIGHTKSGQVRDRALDPREHHSRQRVIDEGQRVKTARRLPGQVPLWAATRTFACDLPTGSAQLLGKQIVHVDAEHP